MELTEHRCHRCGGELTKKSSTEWKCPYCGSSYDDTTALKHTADMHEMFDEAKRELVNNARRNLYDATVAKYISSEDVKDACREIKKYLPDDFRANFYEIAADSNVKRTAKAIRKIDENKYFDEIENIISFCLKDLQPDYLLDLNNLIERAYKKRGELQTFERFATEISLQAEKVQQGVYETTLPRDVFIAYSSKDMDHVSELLDVLEGRDGLKCFVAARNLRHGRGAVENYNKALEEAMDNCKSIVFVSTTNSRSFGCDALKIELPHIKAQDIANAPGQYRNNYVMIPHEYKKPRVEYRVEESRGKNAADQIVKEFFDGYEWALSSESVSERIAKQLFDSAVTVSAPVIDNKQNERKKYCISCGCENTADASFCAQCGRTEFANSAEELVKIKNKRELEERRAREEAQRRAERAEAEKLAAQKKAADKKTFHEPPPKKKRHGCLITFIVIICIVIFFSIAVALIDDMINENYYGEPTYDDPYQSPEDTTQPSIPLEAFPVTGTYNDLPYELSEDGVLTISGYGDLFGSSYAQLYAEAFDGYNYSSIYAKEFVKKIVISEGIVSIGNSVFQYMDALEEVELSSGMTAIGKYAFADCTRLRTIGLSSVQIIGVGAFTNCFSLKEADISSASSIEDSAFMSCESLSSVNVGDQLTYVHYNAFYNTPFYDLLSPDAPLYLGAHLYRVHPETSGRFEIPENIMYISAQAFYECQQITEIFIPTSVVSIGDMAFCNANNVSNILYSGDRTAWDSIEKGWDYDANTGSWTQNNSGTYQLWCLSGDRAPDSSDPYTDGLEFRMDDSGEFIWVTGYTGAESTVVIPSYYLGFPVERIADRAFSNSAIDSVAIPSTMKEIGEKAFENSTISSISVGEGCELSRVGRNAFADTKLLFSDGSIERPVYIGNALVYVPYSEYELFTIEPGTTLIAEYAFYDRDSIYSVFVPKSVRSAGDYAFNNASYIEYIFYEGTEEEAASVRFGEYCVDHCGISTSSGSVTVLYLNNEYDPSDTDPYTEGLKFYVDIENRAVSVIGYTGTTKDIVIPSRYFGVSVEEISDNAFESSSIESISIPASIKRIGGRAFAYSQIASVDVADGSLLNFIGYEAFYATPMESNVKVDSPLYIGNCLVLVSKNAAGVFTISSGTTFIAGYAFSDSQFSSVVIPESVTYIAPYAFYNARNVGELVCLGTEEQWESVTKGENWDYSCGYNTPKVGYTVHFLNGEYDPEVTEPYTAKLEFSYISDTNSYAVSGYSGSDTNIVIPAKYMTLPVTEISSHAFANSKITSVEIPETVTAIRSSAFEQSALTSIFIPASVTTIDYSAFNSCLALTSVEFAPDTSLTYIPQNAFSNCNIKVLNIPDSITSISTYAFQSNKNLKQVLTTSESKLEKIGSNAFYGCSSLEEVVLPSTLTSADSYSFNGCNKLTTLTAPGACLNCFPKENLVTVTVNGSGLIPNSAFSNCRKLEKVTIESGITSMGTYVFNNCTALTSVSLPESLTTIGNYAFSNCAILSEIELPEGVETISDYAFDSCAALSSVILPSTVEKIGSYAFRNCSELSEITLPEGLTALGSSAFYNCKSITSVNIPSTLTVIPSYAFSYCGLTSVTIPSTVSTVQEQAFSYCGSLTEVTIDGNIDSMKGTAFYNCNIKTASLPGEMITHMPKENLVTVNVTSGDILASTFSNCTTLREVNMHENIEMIGENAFSNCTSLLSIELPASLSGINTTAFSGCTSLAEIINHTVHNVSSFAPNSVLAIHSGESLIEYIDDYAFISADSGIYLIAYLGNDTDLVLPESCNGSSYIVRKSSFETKNYITSVTVKGASAIEDRAFFDCDGIVKLVIGDSVKSIGTYAFANCSNLSNVSLGSSLEVIGASAFYSCSSLAKLTMPSSVKEIGISAFRYCSKLESVIMSAGTEFEIYSSYSASPTYTYTADTNSSTNAQSLKNTYSGYTWRKKA